MGGIQLAIRTASVLSKRKSARVDAALDRVTRKPAQQRSPTTPPRWADARPMLGHREGQPLHSLEARAVQYEPRGTVRCCYPGAVAAHPDTETIRNTSTLTKG